MAGEEAMGSAMEVRVRSLAGDSATVMAADDWTVAKLKASLKQSFPAAKDSDNFHLFFRGAKMKMDNHLVKYMINKEDFVVLVPFSKKNKHSTNFDHSGRSMDFESHSVPSYASSRSNSSCTHNMGKLPSVADATSDKMAVMNTCNIKNNNDVNDNSGKVSMRTLAKKRKRYSSHFCQSLCVLVDDLLHSGCSTSLNVQTCEKIHQIVGKEHCLHDSELGNCLLFEEFPRIYTRCAAQVSGSLESKFCVCPAWLKKLLKAFSLLNILSSFVQLVGKSITHSYLEETIKHFNRTGSEVISIVEVKQLSVLCPKVIVYGDQKVKYTKLNEVITIVDSSSAMDDKSEFEQYNDSTANMKHSSATPMLKAVEKRDSIFRAELWMAIKCFMRVEQIGKIKSFSLDELLTFMRDRGRLGSALKHIEKNKSRAYTTASGLDGCKDILALRNKDLDGISLEPFEVTSHDLNIARKIATTKEKAPLLPIDMVEHLKKEIGSDGQIVHIENIGARKAVYVELPENLLDATYNVLKRIGISKLYCHQAESMKASLSGKNVVVATSTSSGKSLCFNIPVLEVLLRSCSSCALYLFPTKALAQDQLRSLLVMTEGLGIDIGVYDGDTSHERRCWLRDNARLLITNPDMLHLTILPNHKQFERILSNLRFIIIDEAHTYKGAFGCHTALVLRRLRRICSHVYGAQPAFVLSTATSANPCEHAMELLNLQNLELIQNDGSPSGSKIFLLWNPPLCSNIKFSPSKSTASMPKEAETTGRRMSAIVEASKLFAEMVQHGLRCIAFCKTRKLSELVLFYACEILKDAAPDLVDAVCAYRAGYMAADRRKIESDLFGGKIRGVAATNALELGIDIGHLDATVHLGFPGSVSSLWQQAGRSGRRKKASISVYVAFEDPIDQYFMRFPHKLFHEPMECCKVNSQNMQVLEQHLPCAAFELPLCLQYDETFFGSELSKAIIDLESKGILHSCSSFSEKAWNYIGEEKFPSRLVHIRAIQSEKYRVIDMITNEVLEEIEESKAFFQVYEGAVFLHQGKSYLVMALKLSEKIALCKVVDVKYYTRTRDYTDIHVIGGNLAYPIKIYEHQLLRTSAQTNACQITTTWFGFYKIRRGTGEIFDTVDLTLPKYSYDSQAVWIRIPHDIKAAVELRNLSFRAGRHAASHTLLNVVPLFIMCNSSDLGVECSHPHDTRYTPERLLLYDKHPGGIGLSAQVHLVFGKMLAAALELVTTCTCSSSYGCPHCIQNVACREYNEVLDKDAAIMILQAVNEAEYP